MQTFRWPQKESGRLRVLCLGAHSDDIEIGCGGTVLRMLHDFPTAEFRWVVLSAPGRRGEEARASAADFLSGADSPRVDLSEFRDGYFPYVGADIKDFFETLKDFAPDVVLTHCRNDRHQDHRLVNELTWNTFRDHLVLEYEIPKYDGDLGIPNAFVYLDKATAQRKLELIVRHFASQRSKHWFTAENLSALMRLRGVECRAPQGFAEAFYGRKICW
jgi:LmbE family N-acetylglucosaminyl deacetylase